MTQAGSRPERLGADGVRRLGAGYRALVAELARLRRATPDDPQVDRLEALAGRARQVVYDAPTREGSFVAFVTRGFWCRVRERPAVLALAAGLLFGPWLLAGLWAFSDTGGALAFVPAEMRGITEPRSAGQDLGFGIDEQSAFASTIFVNNARVAIVAFAGGLLLGAGTAAVLVVNGFVLGSVFGLAIGAGNTEVLVELTAAHGGLELSAIVVAGAAGLRMGGALVDPGVRPRGEALRAEARAGVEMLLGAIACLVLAALVEGYATPRALGAGNALAFGVISAVAFWTSVVVRGRPARPVRPALSP